MILTLNSTINIIRYMNDGNGNDTRMTGGRKDFTKNHEAWSTLDRVLPWQKAQPGISPRFMPRVRLRAF